MEGMMDKKMGKEMKPMMGMMGQTHKPMEHMPSKEQTHGMEKDMMMMKTHHMMTQGDTHQMQKPGYFPPDNPMSSNVYKHSNRLGAGAEKRKGLNKQDKVHAVMGEFKRGTLHSGSGTIVKNKKQAIAIAMSEAGLSKKRK